MTFIINPFVFGAVVTLSGETASDPGTFGSKRAGIRVNTDGTMDKGIGDPAFYSQIDASTDWIIPNGDASSSYEVRCSNATGIHLTGDTQDTWLAISSNREWYVSGNNLASERTSTFDLEIRFNGGSVLASASYTVSAGGAGST